MKQILGFLVAIFFTLLISSSQAMAASSISVTVQSTAGSADGTVSSIINTLKDVQTWQNNHYYTETITDGHTIFNIGDWENIGSDTNNINMDLSSVIKDFSSLQGHTISTASYKQLENVPGMVSALRETYKSDVLHLNGEGAFTHLDVSKETGAYKQITEEYNGILAGNNQAVEQTGKLLSEVDGIVVVFSGDITGGHHTMNIGPFKTGSVGSQRAPHNLGRDLGYGAASFLLIQLLRYLFPTKWRFGGNNTFGNNNLNGLDVSGGLSGDGTDSGTTLERVVSAFESGDKVNQFQSVVNNVFPGSSEFRDAFRHGTGTWDKVSSKIAFLGDVNDIVNPYSTASQRTRGILNLGSNLSASVVIGIILNFTPEGRVADVTSLVISVGATHLNHYLAAKYGASITTGIQNTTQNLSTLDPNWQGDIANQYSQELNHPVSFFSSTFQSVKSGWSTFWSVFK